MVHGHPVFAACYRIFGGLADRVLEPGGRLLPEPVRPVTLPGMRITRPGIAGVARKPVG